MLCISVIKFYGKSTRQQCVRFLAIVCECHACMAETYNYYTYMLTNTYILYYETAKSKNIHTFYVNLLTSLQVFVC